MEMIKKEKEVKKMIKRKGQSVLEYVLILSVVIGAVIFAAAKFMKPAVEQGYEDAGSTMENATGKFSSMIGGGN